MTLARGALYGSGIFTTVALRNGEPWFWDKHWRRLADNASRIGLDLTHHSEETTKAALDDAIRTSEIDVSRARITFTDERPSEIWPGHKAEKSTTLHILVSQNRIAPTRFKVTVSPFRVNSRSPLAGVKSCNYLENILAIDEAKGRGFHEGIRVNERGHITSGCMSNVFWLKGDRLYTSALSTGCLPGTTREFVLENIECDEVAAEIDEIKAADAVFLTSTGLGIVEVAESDGRRLARSGHPILGLAAKLSE